ncbi:MAG: haloacid dehalogenase type II, partial [Mycobacteriaceae bacterium]|nr:haloacid dehalogenase type II [Mycobacteriaceae bacterium]
MATPPVLVFDVNETLIDTQSLAPLFEELFGDRSVLREWFNQLVMYSMTATLSDHYVDFATLAGGVLQMLADVHQVQFTDDDAQRLTASMRRMPAYPDSADGLAQLRDKGFRLVTLTNSPHPAGMQTALESAGLADFFEHRFTVDACQAFKPAPSVYRYVCEQLEVAPTDCLMVAAHVWDLLGAQNVGFGTALITRPGNAPLPIDELPQPDLIAGSLLDLARQLARTTKGT